MINTYEELLDRLSTMNLGSSVLQISTSVAAVQLNAPLNPDRELYRKSEDWLERIIAGRVVRAWDSENKKWKVRADCHAKIRESIAAELLQLIVACSDARMPERTILYKEYKSFNTRYADRPQYFTEIIAIINYFAASRTDSTCKPNVVGLLNLLRKKYNGKSS